MDTGCAQACPWGPRLGAPHTLLPHHLCASSCFFRVVCFCRSEAILPTGRWGGAKWSQNLGCWCEHSGWELTPLSASHTGEQDPEVVLRATGRASFSLARPGTLGWHAWRAPLSPISGCPSRPPVTNTHFRFATPEWGAGRCGRFPAPLFHDFFGGWGGQR